MNVPYFEWNEQSTKADKETYLLGALNAVGWSPPSVQRDDSAPRPSLAAEGHPQTQNDSSSAGESSGSDAGGGQDESAGLGALSRADRLALLKQSSSGLSRHQVLLKRAVQRKL